MGSLGSQGLIMHKDKIGKPFPFRTIVLCYNTDFPRSPLKVYMVHVQSKWRATQMQMYKTPIDYQQKAS